MALIFPEPKKQESLGGSIGLSPCSIVLVEDADPMERVTAEIVAGAIERATGKRPAIGSDPGEGAAIYVGAAAKRVEGAGAALADTADDREAYAVVAQAGSIALLGRTPVGTLYAGQTLRRMLRREDGAVVVDAVRIVDWPDFKHRGLYIESKWGPDLMNLRDWEELVDYMAALKMNALGVGVYCCWGVQYEGKRTEFAMVPFPGHPEIQTPKTIRYYSAKEKQWKALSYLPPMVEDDFFGDLVAYAKSRGIIVRPHFNGPGHTTLIPHTHPEVAAKDEAGKPTGYGYCLSQEATYDLLFELWDSVIDRYLTPNGIDWFHMGLDEIYPVTGTDEEDPERSVDPWCKCPECRGREHADLLADYVVRATQHLIAKGMRNITIWNDHLEHSGMLTPDFVAKLETAGVKDNVILQWWRYNEPVLEIPTDLGLRAWTTPMPCYWFWLLYEDLTANIYPHLHLGYRAGAEGADAYATFDPAFDRNYYCLAEYAWNQTTVGDIYQFKSKYAEKVMDARGYDAVEAFEKFDQAYGNLSAVRSTLDMLLYYWHSYSRARSQYPRNVVRQLLNDGLRAMGMYRGCRTNLQRAHALFSERRNQAPDPALIDEYLFECERLMAVVDAYDAILAGVKQTREALKAGDAEALKQGLAAAGDTFAKGLTAMDSMMAFGEEVKKHYLLPQILRDLSVLRQYLAELVAATESAAASQAAVQRLGKMLADLG
ncbi:MAG: family 20 glycosylhydrolase [Anaerolineae bacterium]